MVVRGAKKQLLSSQENKYYCFFLFDPFLIWKSGNPPNTKFNLYPIVSLQFIFSVFFSRIQELEANEWDEADRGVALLLLLPLAPNCSHFFRLLLITLLLFFLSSLPVECGCACACVRVRLRSGYINDLARPPSNFHVRDIDTHTLPCTTHSSSNKSACLCVCMCVRVREKAEIRHWKCRRWGEGDYIPLLQLLSSAIDMRKAPRWIWKSSETSVTQWERGWKQRSLESMFQRAQQQPRLPLYIEYIRLTSTLTALKVIRKHIVQAIIRTQLNYSSNILNMFLYQSGIALLQNESPTPDYIFPRFCLRAKLQFSRKVAILAKSTNAVRDEIYVYASKGSFINDVTPIWMFFCP